jgi:hypothetical protein
MPNKGAVKEREEEGQHDPQDHKSQYAHNCVIPAKIQFLCQIETPITPKPDFS